MKTWKKIAVGVSSAALVLGSFVPGVLAAAETSNTNITDHSYARSVARDRDNLRVDNSTVGVDFTNIDVALANTGFNDQSDNEDENLMESSNADALYATANFANVNETEFGESSGAKASNDNIDDHSGDPCGDTCSCCEGAPCGEPEGVPCEPLGEPPCDTCPDDQCPEPCDCPKACPVTAIADDSDNFTVGNNNSGTIFTNVTASVANTGLNRQNRNEDLNSMTAGSAISTAGASNVVNNNYAKIGAGTSGSAEASNTNITDHSYAKAVARDKDTVNVSNSNVGTDVTNVTASVANSGLNEQSDNEDDNDMTTGAVDSYAETNNFVNVNETQVDVGGGAKASNDNVDDHSYAETKANDNDTVNVTNNNSGTKVTNVSVSVANSGGNRQTCNEDGNTMRTGSAISTGVTTNVVNGNQTYVGVTPTP